MTYLLADLLLAGTDQLHIILSAFLLHVHIACSTDRSNSHTILSVRPSRSGVLSRRMNIWSCCLRHQVGQSF